MPYPAPVRMKRQYTFNRKALKDSMRIGGSQRILDSHDIQHALEHLEGDTYPNRPGYSMNQTINNLCQENGVPVYARGALLDEVERYKDACIIEGNEVYPGKGVLITWLAHDYANDATIRMPGVKKRDAYKRIKEGMKKKFSGNSSYQKAKLIHEYESRLAMLKMKNRSRADIATDAGPVHDERVVKRELPPAGIQLSFDF